MYDAHAKLDSYKEGWLSLATGADRAMFISAATSTLWDGCDPPKGSSWEACYYRIYSRLVCGDKDGVRVAVNDFSGGVAGNKPPSQTQHRKLSRVSKFVPGDHYHVADLDTKFNTLDEAIEAIEKTGRTYAGLTEKYVYPNQSD